MSEHDPILAAIQATKYAEAVMRRTAAGPDESHTDWQPKYKGDSNPTVHKWHPPYGETHVKYHIWRAGGGRNPIIWGANHHGTYQGVKTVKSPLRDDDQEFEMPVYSNEDEVEQLGRFRKPEQAKAAAEAHYRDNYSQPPKHDYDIDSIMGEHPQAPSGGKSGLGDDEDYSRIFDAVRRALKKAGAVLRRTAAENEPYQMSDELKSLLADHVRKQFQKNKAQQPGPAKPEGSYDWGVKEDEDGPWLSSTPNGGGGGHLLSVFPPTDDDPDFSWHHSSGGQVVDRGFASSQEQAQRNAEASHKATSWSPDDKQDPFDPRIIGAGLHARLAAQAAAVDSGVMGRISAELSPPCPDCGQVAGFDEHMVSPRVKVCRNCEYPMTDIGHDGLLENVLRGHDKAIGDLPETDHPSLGKHGRYVRSQYDDLPPLPDDFHVPDNLGREKNTSGVEPWMDPEEFIKYHNDYFGKESDSTTQSNIRDMSTNSLHSYWQDLEKARGKTPDQLSDERQQSKDKAKGIADGLWNSFYPPEEEEGRKAVQNMDTVNKLMSNGWQPEQIKYDEDDQPYGHYQHPSGWNVSDYGGMYKEIGHTATPGESHDVINTSHNIDGQDYHEPFGPADAHAHIENQLHGDPEETGGMFHQLAQDHPAIKKYKPPTH